MDEGGNEAGAGSGITDGLAKAPLGRRRFLASLGAAAALVGFNSVTGRWVTAAEASSRVSPFHALPPLDGHVYTDYKHRARDSTDQGNLYHVLPAAVLVPGSVADIQKMVRFCRQHGLKVATRGQHHSMGGQGLSPGLVIESEWLHRVHTVASDHVVVDAGITWKALVEKTLEHGLRPRALLGYQGLSVGGTLSVGGCPMTPRWGGLVDNVRALEVVTGAGDLVQCSERQHRELFEAMLGGLGQCGVITKATIELVPALPRARTYLLTYTDAATFFADFRVLFDRGEVDDCFNVCMPPASPQFTYQINATVFFDPAAPPDDAHLLRGLSLPAALVPKRDRGYFEYVTDVDNLYGVQKVALQWDQLKKPWYDVWMPDDTVEQHVRDVVADLEPDDVGAGGFLVMFAHRPSRMRRPFYRLPEARGADRVWLFDVLTTSNLPITDSGYDIRLRARNRAWFDQARALGGVRYPIGVLDFHRADWRQHYGGAWAEFHRRKRLYDPDNIMTPGPGIFS